MNNPYKTLPTVSQEARALWLRAREVGIRFDLIEIGKPRLQVIYEDMQFKSIDGVVYERDVAHQKREFEELIETHRENLTNLALFRRRAQDFLDMLDSIGNDDTVSDVLQQCRAKLAGAR